MISKNNLKIMIIFSFLGYIIALIIGIIITYTNINNKKVDNDNIKESVCVAGYNEYPISCQPNEGCESVYTCAKREDVLFPYKDELKRRIIKSFYTYGLLGAFIGIWVSVFYETYVLKK
ncbi:MAG: hypothetical protein HQ538_02495 [Parcubacteria group bacterium]|nr:hypothetical protein [Parcubacteria group bacterium]